VRELTYDMMIYIKLSCTFREIIYFNASIL